MPTYTFDFDLDAWIQNLEITADNYEEALEKLKSMKIEDIIDEGYCKRFDINDIDCESDEDDNFNDEDNYEE